MQATETKQSEGIDIEVYDKVKDEIENLIDGHDGALILSVLSHLIGEVGVNCGVDLSSVIKASALSIVHVYASQLPDDNEPIH
jgi:F420-0:gamma-glutamyl ligase